MQAVLFQTGVLGDLDRPLAKQVLGRIAPTLRSTAHTLTLEQATNVLSTVALLSCFDVKLIAAVVDRALPEMPSAQPKTIAALCYALGISGYSDHRLMRVRSSIFCTDAVLLVYFSIVNKKPRQKHTDSAPPP